MTLGLTRRSGAAIVLALLLATVCHAHGEWLDFSRAVIVRPAQLGPVEQQAVTFLIEEVEKRTQVRWEQQETWPEASVPVVVVGPFPALAQWSAPRLGHLFDGRKPGAAEGYFLETSAHEASGRIVVAGHDARGVMFGVGRLLRELRMARGKVQIPDRLEFSSAPDSALRGHQLGYRPKTNSYDAWDIATWEQYLRDLIVFGCNAIELIPPRSDDAADSPHFPRPPLQMMMAMSRLADRYGLDVWTWYPAMDKDYSDAATVESALKEWGEVLKVLPRLDAVFVPGGDPGHTQPKHLLNLLERQARQLRQWHSRAQMWVSPQSFDAAWMHEFLSILNSERPAWLNGVVFGPQVRLPLSKLREAVPAEYPIRHYPDITHSRQCQYPVRDWDVAFAVTEARECINPRPLDEAAIYRATCPQTIGFITYSEGCNDDVNKAVWSALGWDRHANVADILRDYGRYFIGERGDDFAQGLLALERNWRGSLLANAGVETTLQQFQTLERAASPRQLQNWRFQQALFRAYYDAYVRRRLIHETDLERQALDRLGQASQTGSLTAIADAERILNQVLTAPIASPLRDRLFELGAALFQSIGMQLSVAKYGAIAVDRGAALDTVDFPLNNRPWLKEQFARIRRLATEPERVKALNQLVEWENPGPGGFYDDLGNPARQPHLIPGLGLDLDPGTFNSPRSGFEEDLVTDDDEPPLQGTRRVSWQDHAEALYDAPLQMRWAGLDPGASYRMRVVYAGDTTRRKIRLVAGNGVEVHPYISRAVPFQPVEFDLPHAVTADGNLVLTWSGEPGLAGNGRGCQVSEVWLMKKQP